jgi:hypothetical protein
MKTSKNVTRLIVAVLGLATIAVHAATLDPFTTSVALTAAGSNPTTSFGDSQTDSGVYAMFDDSRWSEAFTFMQGGGTDPWTIDNAVTIGAGTATFEIERTGAGTKGTNVAAAYLDYIPNAEVDLSGLTLSFDVLASTQSGTWLDGDSYTASGFAIGLFDGSNHDYYAVGGTSTVLPGVGSYDILLDNTLFPTVNLSNVTYMEIGLFNEPKNANAFSGSITISNLEIAPIPEPASLVLLGLTGSALLLRRRRG